MRPIDCLKLKGMPAQIPDGSRDSLPGFFVEMGYKTGVEIGVFHGEFTEKLCKAGLTIHAIDPWIGYGGAGRSEKTQSKQDTNYQSAIKRLSQYKNCHIVRKTSMEALKNFAPSSLDFVYIDGDHRFRYVAEDIAEWYAIVKPGGIVSGHDYFDTPPNADNLICQVKSVVDAFIGTYGIENFYVLGTESDKNPSWMFLKP